MSIYMTIGMVCHGVHIQTYLVPGVLYLWKNMHGQKANLGFSGYWISGYGRGRSVGRLVGHTLGRKQTWARRYTSVGLTSCSFLLQLFPFL